MADDFMDLLSGAGATGGQDEKGMDDLLGSLLGGGQAGGGQADMGDMAGLLGGLMGGGQAGSGQADMGDMAGLLGGLMGGGGGQAAGGGLGGLLGGLMGGGGGGGLGGLLGGLMGGGGNQMNFGGGGSGVSLPFADTLAEKLGISEQMANMLIMGAIGLLTSSMAKNRSGDRSGAVDLDSMTDPDFIRASGVAGRLSSQMGISEDDAILGLQQTMGLMAAGSPPAAPKATPAKKKTAKKKTAKKTTATTAKPATKPKKSTTNSTKTAPKKKSTKKESGSDFMSLLDDPNG